MEPEPSAAEIKAFREVVLDKIASLEENEFHPKDLARIKESDQWLKRFLMHHESKQSEALQMVVTVLKWRKEVEANDMNEKKIKTEIIEPGGFFPHGRDVDGCLLFVFKCKTYVKNQVDTNEIKKCVIFWLERLEREENGKQITLFFDMEGCGLSNMDLDFTKYLIGLFKDYYPYFLNYIIIFEMPWILNAAFSVIKSWLPEKAVKKIKSAKKSTLNKWVAPDQALTCWGGTDNYVFQFSPEECDAPDANANNRKVRFDDSAPTGGQGALISVKPDSLLRFANGNGEYASTIEVTNISSEPVSFKVRTTTPEKFRVKPGHGCVEPNGTRVIHVTLQPAYLSSNLIKDKFLILSTAVQRADMTQEEVSDLWKTMGAKKDNPIHLRCASLVEANGNGIKKADSDQLSKLVRTLQDIRDLQQEQNSLSRHIKYSQYLILLVLLILAFTIARVVFANHCPN